MYDEEKLLLFGTITRAHGITGEVAVSLTSPNLRLSKKPRKVWLESNSNYLHQWGVEYLKIGEKETLLKLRNITTREEASYLKGIKVYIDTKSLMESDIKKTIGFVIKDSSSGRELGKVIKVDDSTVQCKLIIDSEYGEIMIPVVEEIVGKIDWKKKVIFINLIDGLIPK
jgi:16S rRNA processing protein RimM